MTLRRLCFLLLVLVALPGTSLPAADTTTPPAAPEPARPDSLSPQVSAAIRTSLPRFHLVEIATPRLQDEPDDAVRLPNVVVRDAKTPAFDERDLLTAPASVAVLKKRYPGALPPGPDPLHSNLPNYALLMARDDDRLEKIQNLTDLADGFRRAGDFSGSKSLTVEIDRTFVRPSDWQTESLDKSANSYRR